MALYAYQAVDASGRAMSRTVEAGSDVTARGMVRDVFRTRNMRALPGPARQVPGGHGRGHRRRRRPR